MALAQHTAPQPSFYRSVYGDALDLLVAKLDACNAAWLHWGLTATQGELLDAWVNSPNLNQALRAFNARTGRRYGTWLARNSYTGLVQKLQRLHLARLTFTLAELVVAASPGYTAYQGTDGQGTTYVALVAQRVTMNPDVLDVALLYQGDETYLVSVPVTSLPNRLNLTELTPHWARGRGLAGQTSYTTCADHRLLINEPLLGRW